MKSKAGTWDVSSLGHQTPWMMLAFNIRYPDARRNFGSLNNLNMFFFKLHLPVLNSHAGFLLDVSNLDSGFGTFGENTAVDERLTLVVGSFLGASIHSCLAFDVRLKSIRNGRNMNETVMRMKVYFLTTLTMS